MNTGEVMQMYTNGAYTAAMHRVLLTSPAKRLSAAFFMFPNMDATIVPLPALITKGRPQQYEATTPRQFISSKFEAVKRRQQEQVHQEWQRAGHQEQQ